MISSETRRLTILVLGMIACLGAYLNDSMILTNVASGLIGFLTGEAVATVPPKG